MDNEDVTLILTLDEFKFLSVMGLHYMLHTGALDDHPFGADLEAAMQRELDRVPKDAKVTLSRKMENASAKQAEIEARNVFNG